MRGHLQARGKDSWRLKVYVGRSADWKKRYVERTVRGTRREAERELARLVVEVDEGRWVASAPMAIAELLDRWLALKATTVEASTLQGYRWIVERFVRPEFGDRKVASLRTIELDEWYAELRVCGGRDRRELSGRTMRIVHTVMRQSLEQAKRWGLISRNPAVDATPPTAKRRKVTPPTVQEAQRLLTAAFDFDSDYGVYLWLSAVTGFRRGEGCALRWTDVDWERSELSIRRSIAQVDQERREKDTKTHQARKMSIDPATLELLRQHRLQAKERALALGVHLADDALLFLDDFSRPWRPDVCTNWFGRLRASLDLEHVRLHDLRHFMATELGRAGVPIATISARLGHGDKATTLNIYSHSLPAADQEAAAYLGSLLQPPNQATQ